MQFPAVILASVRVGDIDCGRLAEGVSPEKLGETLPHETIRVEPTHDDPPYTK
jgi:hypothetical protein